MAVLTVVQIVQLKVIIRRIYRYLKQYTLLIFLDIDFLKSLTHGEITILGGTNVAMQLSLPPFHDGVSEDLQLAIRQYCCPPNDQLAHELSVESIDPLVVRSNYYLVHHRCKRT